MRRSASVSVRGVTLGLLQGEVLKKLIRGDRGFLYVTVRMRAGDTVCDENVRRSFVRRIESGSPGFEEPLALDRLFLRYERRAVA